jgi:hypothetical protein
MVGVSMAPLAMNLARKGGQNVYAQDNSQREVDCQRGLLKTEA